MPEQQETSAGTWRPPKSWNPSLTDTGGQGIEAVAMLPWLGMMHQWQLQCDLWYLFFSWSTMYQHLTCPDMRGHEKATIPCVWQYTPLHTSSWTCCMDLSMATSPEQTAQLFADFENVIVSYATHPEGCDWKMLLRVNVRFSELHFTWSAKSVIYHPSLKYMRHWSNIMAFPGLLI